eukprot:TRINITY_DN230_c4_g1_i1.p1 TRINITY_DN230_c4_g1~~TRINITY_DN230_c4_g1_i1.p1  ORF type:complete len:719 (+),score=184.04 TRINITY_DN230_c4_g1_i1:423-2579(+)
MTTAIQILLSTSSSPTATSNFRALTPNVPEICRGIYNHWEQKRIERKGVPLLRSLRPRAVMTDSLGIPLWTPQTIQKLTEEEIQDTSVGLKNFVDQLVDLRYVMEVVKQREQIKHKLSLINLDMFEMEYFPVHYNCRRILKFLKSKDHIKLFSYPVSWNEERDYYNVIVKPIDLYTIKTNLDSDMYQTEEQFMGDINLMFSNALTYYNVGSRTYSYVERLKSLLDEHIKFYSVSNLKYEDISFEDQFKGLSLQSPSKPGHLNQIIVSSEEHPETSGLHKKRKMDNAEDFDGISPIKKRRIDNSSTPDSYISPPTSSPSRVSNRITSPHSLSSLLNNAPSSMEISTLITTTHVNNSLPKTMSPSFVLNTSNDHVDMMDTSIPHDNMEDLSNTSLDETSRKRKRMEIDEHTNKRQKLHSEKNENMDDKEEKQEDKQEEGREDKEEEDKEATMDTEDTAENNKEENRQSMEDKKKEENKEKEEEEDNEEDKEVKMDTEDTVENFKEGKENICTDRSMVDVEETPIASPNIADDDYTNNDHNSSPNIQISDNEDNNIETRKKSVVDNDERIDSSNDNNNKEEKEEEKQNEEMEDKDNNNNVHKHEKENDVVVAKNKIDDSSDIDRSSSSSEDNESDSEAELEYPEKIDFSKSKNRRPYTSRQLNKPDQSIIRTKIKPDTNELLLVVNIKKVWNTSPSKVRFKLETIPCFQQFSTHRKKFVTL